MVCAVIDFGCFDSTQFVNANGMKLNDGMGAMEDGSVVGEVQRCTSESETWHDMPTET